MTKTELITAIAQATGQKRTVAEQVLNAGLQQMSEALRRGEKVQVLPFGIFSIGQRSARPGRNPRTGEFIQIPAKRGVKFRASAILQQSLDGQPVPASQQPVEEYPASPTPRKTKQSKA
jgi:DNA-binding protein HU-beta